MATTRVNRVTYVLHATMQTGVIKNVRVYVCNFSDILISYIAEVPKRLKVKPILEFFFTLVIHSSLMMTFF